MHQKGPKFYQMVRETNRIMFAEELLETANFDVVILTDKSAIWLEQQGKICFMKDGRPPNLKPKAKYPFKAHIWAGISKRGASPLLIFAGIMQ